jgi:hypothetical protein
MGTLLGGMLIFGLVMVVVGIAGFIFWLWMLISAIANRYEHKGVWILALLLFNIVAAFVFYFTAYQKIKTVKKVSRQMPTDGATY